MHVTTSLCRNCYTFQYVYLYIYQVCILLRRRLSRDHSVSCPAYHLELSNTNSFTGLIRLIHMTRSRVFPIRTEWYDAPFAFRNLAKAFKHNTMYLAFTFQWPSNSNKNDSLLLLFDDLWKVKPEIACRD